MQVPPFSLTEQLHHLGEQLDAAVLQVLRSGQYIGGGLIADFQHAFSSSVHTPYATRRTLCTVPLILVLRGLRIYPHTVVCLSCPLLLLRAEALLLSRCDVETQEDDRRPIDRHARGDLVEGDSLEERLHVRER